LNPDNGEVAEWSKAVDSKSTVGKLTVGSNPTLSSILLPMCELGEVTEWSKVHDWKSCVAQVTVGSNPTLSASFARIARPRRGRR
jgi:hypothetical protein